MSNSSFVCLAKRSAYSKIWTKYSKSKSIWIINSLNLVNNCVQLHFRVEIVCADCISFACCVYSHTQKIRSFFYIYRSHPEKIYIKRKVEQVFKTTVKEEENIFSSFRNLVFAQSSFSRYAGLDDVSSLIVYSVSFYCLFWCVPNSSWLLLACQSTWFEIKWYDIMMTFEVINQNYFSKPIFHLALSLPFQNKNVFLRLRVEKW